ncbi:AEC family transporter [Staphylococcus pseudoxylosus]|uniref:AEC family transporter n=1 Tax=Staphylococcus pseudoxylosus TaxID=2282419 RepID=UPI00298FC599|nr:AEC family transporter [Staphylococcus pseudoxylosus]MDW8797651.1 AEC family transporter [Staphylococcus pseudoxylosus]MEB6037071.1 AEC family transporter [Staphylococcus pseudoxylosus]MEB6044217.1 AEC family transporter [Staphylococcus pseudoxylosus]MEB7764442.1 AEC family transporter [Staphylococcus pseudoxylosus]MEB8009361.1 AEC family transporter [Staphylococcus pseudoxylosus]
MFIFIILEVILPILLLIVIGAFLQRKFDFKLQNFSTLITYCLMPAAVFINIYHIKIEFQVFSQIIYYVVIYSISLICISHIIAKLLKLEDGEGAALKNSISLMNSGNYGLPVSQFIFSQNPLGVSVQILILVFQNLLTYSYGMYNLLSATSSIKDIATFFLKLPVFHALLLGVFFQVFEIKLPQFALIPIEQLSDGFGSIALLLLGAQLSKIKFKFFHRVITISLIGRLLVGPMVSLAAIYILNIDGIIAQSLLIASSFPTSRNASTIAMEYQVEPELHAQIVLFSTLFSMLTVTGVIYLSYVLF